METLKPHQERIEDRLNSLYQWIEKQKPLIISSDKIKITLNIKGNRVTGEVTQYPE